MIYGRRAKWNKPHKTGPHRRLQLLEQTRDSKCRLCRLSDTTEGSVCVMGKGSPVSSIMIVGEAPGAAEERTGRPFCGRSGRLLDQILRKLGIQRHCYITNVVKCRPPRNRAPTERETVACCRYLAAEVRIIKPKCMVLLGNTARDAMGYHPKDIDRGIPLYTNHPLGNFNLMWTYHPAYALRNPSAVRVIQNHLSWCVPFTS